MDKTKTPVLGIDLGGTKISAGLVVNNAVVKTPKRVPTPHGAEHITEALIALVNEFKQTEPILGVGIATAGIVNTETGEVVGSTGNLPGWEGTPIKKIIEARTGLKVHVENDANAAAYGEYKATGFVDKTCVVAVTLGTGIGVGIVIHQDLYRGANYAGGECGHIKVSMDNRRRCTCGLWDCWEAYGSGRGFVVTGHEIVASITEVQSVLASKKTILTSEDILEAAAAGDQVAKDILYKWHEHVACGLVSLCHTLDPDCFVISGGMGKFVDFKLLKEMVAERTLPRISEKLEIHPAVLGQYAGLIGAADLVLDTTLKNQKLQAVN